MTALAPTTPQRPLIWPDLVLDLHDMLMGVDQPVYVVGGAVRDAYRHHPVHDLDLATPEQAIRLGRTIANHFDGDVFVLDYERDVARVLLETLEGRFVLDVARFRAEDLLADLMDRDFTVNAIAVDLKSDLKHIIDPLNGERDLIDKIIRRCSPQAISDDPIRALRAVRQSIQLGARIERETLKDVRATVPNLLDVSQERIRDEFVKMLQLRTPAKGLRIAERLGLLQMIIPEIENLHEVSESPYIADGLEHTLLVVEKLNSVLETVSATRTDHTAAAFGLGMVVVALDRFRRPLQEHLATNWPNGRPHSVLLLLAALLHDVGKPEVERAGKLEEIDFPGYEIVSETLAENRVAELRLSNAEKARIASIIRYHTLPFAVSQSLNDLTIHRFWHRLGVAGVDVCLLAMADYLGTVGHQIDQDEWIHFLDQIQQLLDAYFNRYEEIVAPPPLLDGNQLMTELDLKPGKHIGALLDLIREGQVTGDIKTVHEALDAARAYLARNGE